MNSNSSRHLAIGLVIVFVLYLFVTVGNEEKPKEYSRTPDPIQSPKLYHSLDNERIYSSRPSESHSQSNLNRKEVLRTNVKGYREATYWGSEHSIDEKTRYQDDYEFDRYIEEEVKLKDADVYWGAEY